MSSNCEQFNSESQYVDEPVENLSNDLYDEPIRATPLEELTYLSTLIDADVKKYFEANKPANNSIADILFYTIQSVSSFNHSVVSILKQDNADNRINRKYFADLWADKFDEFDRFLTMYIPYEIRKNKSQLDYYQNDIDLIANYVNTIKNRLNDWYNE